MSSVGLPRLFRAGEQFHGYEAKGNGMSAGILEMFRKSGDDNVGQTLIRLAMLAQARHRYETAQAAAGASMTHGAHGGALQPEAGEFDHDAAAHTEVDR